MNLAKSLLFIILLATAHLTSAQDLPLLSYDELVSVSKESHNLEDKLEKLFSSVDIQTSQRIPKASTHPKLGKSFTLITWNIEKSLNIKGIVKLLKLPMSKVKAQMSGLKEKKKKKILDQIERIKNADAIVLQEMDLGVNRSGYTYAAEELAKALQMNFAYAPTQVEIDPNLMMINMTEKGFSEHKRKYKGLFGLAVLSRYPIESAVSFPLKNQTYDWYKEEKKFYKADIIEKVRRVGAKVLLEVDIIRELKRGGRNFFRVDLSVPYLPEKKLTIINAHLEIKSSPKKRANQMKEILSYIKDIDNNIILAGDFNSSTKSAASTSFYRFSKQVLTDKSQYLSIATSAVLPGTGSIINFLRNGLIALRTYKNPTRLHVPFLLENPARGLFKSIFNFEFDDGHMFDLRGSKLRSIGEAGRLSNSNHKTFIGYHKTFKTKRSFLHFGRERLDWIFVKSYVKDNRKRRSGSDEPYQFAPHFGEVLEHFNKSFPGRYSDHNPMSVVLPFNEPVELNKKELDYYQRIEREARESSSHFGRYIPAAK